MKKKDKKKLRYVITLCLFILINCGKRGPLTLPSEVLPKPLETLNLFQTGETIRLQMQFPTLLSDNKTEFEIHKIKKIFVHYSSQTLPQKKFRKKSILLLKLNPGDLAQKNDAYFIHIPFKVKNLDNQSHYFALRYNYEKKKAPLSPTSTIKTQVPAKPIGDLKITQEKKVVRLSWTRPKLNMLDQPIHSLSGYNVYRKIGSQSEDNEEAEFQKINRENVLVEYLEDIDTSLEGQYTYYVSVIHAADIESAASNQVGVEIKDVFPPDIPLNLMVFKAKDHMFLTWEKVKDKDLSHYRIYRKISTQEEFKLIADQVTDNFFKDQKVRKDTLYLYTVSAVDAKGNESEPSDTAKEEF